VHEIVAGALQGEMTTNVSSHQVRVAEALVAAVPSIDRMRVEHSFVLRRNGFDYHGIIDVFGYTKDTTPWGLPNALPIVLDHKTSSNPECWGLTEAQLPEDEQAIVYAAYAMHQSGAGGVHLQWSYVNSKGPPKVTPVCVKVTREHVEKRLEVLDQRALKIVEARKAATAVDLPYNPDACSDFGGCPFAEHCPRTLDDKLPKRKETMPTLEEMLAANPVNSPEAPEDLSSIVEGSKAQLDKESNGKKVPTEPVKLDADTLLGLLAERGTVTVVSRQSDATTATPYCHGRTLNALIGKGQIRVEGEGNTKTVHPPPSEAPSIDGAEASWAAKELAAKVPSVPTAAIRDEPARGVRIPPLVLRQLEELVASGLYGSTPAEAAEHLILERLRQMRGS
jgi:hypothetical protein